MFYLLTIWSNFNPELTHRISGWRSLKYRRPNGTISGIWWTKCIDYRCLVFEKVKMLSHLMSFFHFGPDLIWPPDPPENCHLTVKKLPKFSFFSKKLPMAIFLKKMKIFGNFFRKNVKFLAIFWQSNGNFPEGQVTSKGDVCHTFFSRDWPRASGRRGLWWNVWRAVSLSSPHTRPTTQSTEESMTGSFLHLVNFWVT